jgi:hypothetical protein
LIIGTKVNASPFSFPSVLDFGTPIQRTTNAQQEGISDGSTLAHGINGMGMGTPFSHEQIVDEEPLRAGGGGAVK